MLSIAALIVTVLTLAAFLLGRSKASALAAGDLSALHSRPSYHGLYCALWTLIAGLTVLLLLNVGMNAFIENRMYTGLPDDMQQFEEIKKQRIISDAKAIAEGRIVSSESDARVAETRQELSAVYKGWNSLRLWLVALSSIIAAATAFAITYMQLSLRWRARNNSERLIKSALAVCAVIAILTTIGILFSLIGETFNFFRNIDWQLQKFLFGTHWSPLSGVFEGKLDPATVGAVPLFAGTFLITLIAMLVAVPIGLMSAIYLSDYASSCVRAWAKPMLELLAGIPTVVYGFFAAITVAPVFRGLGETIGLSVASESALAAGTVMGIMIIPFISSLSDDVINAVPQSLRDGSYGLGATKAETITMVVLPAALPGIVSAILLGISRAVGETMIVVMAAGQGANLTWNPLEAVTTVTVQIVALITGDTEADTAAGPAFALGFTLFIITLALNMLALRVVQKYRLKYE